MRFVYQIQCLIIVVVMFLFPLISTETLSVTDLYPNGLIGPEQSHFLSLDESSLNLTWTSRTQFIPQTIKNGSTAVGDHVALNATWEGQINGGNVTNTSLMITDGFTYTTTRPLIPTDGSFSTFPPFPVEDIDWLEISGISSGDEVDITGYAASDCDYFAFPGSMLIQEYTFSNNLLGSQMATGDIPEHGNFIWESDSNVMVLGCYNYDNVVGNYTISAIIGNLEINSITGNSLVLDTYWLDSHNDTYEITVAAVTDLNESFAFKFENITISNFFAPQFVSTHIYQFSSDDLTFNISWSCSDSNSDDANYYSVWLSNNDGISYMRFDYNLSQTWILWNSSGWLPDIYFVRIRAYSVDATSPDCTFEDPPYSYWPGDYADTFPPPINAGDAYSHPPGYYTLDIDLAANSSYFFGSSGNILTATLTFDYSLPFSVDYYVLDNGSSWIQGEYQPYSYSSMLEINIDGLSIGHHILQITISNFQTTSQSLTIDVLVPSSIDTNPTPTGISGILFQVLTIGISIVSLSIIAVVVVLSIRLKRNQVVEYDTPEDIGLE